MTNRARLVSTGAIILLLTTGVFAQQGTQPRATPFSAAPATQTNELIIPSANAKPTAPLASPGGGVQLAIYLCLLIALLGGGSYLLKNGFNFLPAKNKGVRKLNVAETRMLGNRQFLVVAEYEGRKMLLGVCPGRIELLSELDGKGGEPFAAQLSESESA